MASYSFFSLLYSLIYSLCLLFLLLSLPLLSSIALIAGHFEFCNEPSHPHPSASPLAGTSLAELVAASCGVSSLFCLPLFSLLPLHVMLRAPLIPAVVQLLLPLQVILSAALVFSFFEENSLKPEPSARVEMIPARKHASHVGVCCWAEPETTTHTHMGGC